jgi:hypothetical protein
MTEGTEEDHDLARSVELGFVVILVIFYRYIMHRNFGSIRIPNYTPPHPRSSAYIYIYIYMVVGLYQYD